MFGLKVLLIIPLLVVITYNILRKRGEYICTYCGFKGHQIIITRGSFIVELCLWLCFIIPGLIYSSWRISSRERLCPGCNHSIMVLLNTPLGQKLQKEFYGDSKPEPKIDPHKIIVLKKR